jgi:hypothetical protein
MDTLNVGASDHTMTISAWLRERGYLLVVSSHGMAFTFGRPGLSAVIAPVPCTLVWDGTEVYVQGGAAGALVRT